MQGATIPIVYPASTFTYVAGLNDHLEVVGFYSDAQDYSHGFVWDSGVYTTVDFPTALFTRTQTVDNAGKVGGFEITNGILQGFIATPTP
jgi:hypothetical protein